jgi:hypothetical protein
MDQKIKVEDKNSSVVKFLKLFNHSNFLTLASQDAEIFEAKTARSRSGIAAEAPRWAIKTLKNEGEKIS